MQYFALIAVASTLAASGVALANVPAQTALRFHVSAPISSNASKAGSPFAFVMVDPIVVDGTAVVERGATGSGTILVAGHAGTSGHEGDITLRLDDVASVDGRRLEFDDQRVEINGRNRKVISAAAGFIPFVGIASMFIRGADIEIAPATVISTVLQRPAHVVAALPAPVATGATAPAAPTASPSAPASPAPRSR